VFLFKLPEASPSASPSRGILNFSREFEVIRFYYTDAIARSLELSFL